MSKKLTREQADWLIETLDKRKYEDSGLQVNDNYELPVRVLKHIINQCTEKEFPHFKLDLGDGYWVKTHCEGENVRFDYCFYNTLRHPSLLYSPEEFRYFVENCQRIVEWFDESR